MLFRYEKVISKEMFTVRTDVPGLDFAAVKERLEELLEATANHLERNWPHQYVTIDSSRIIFFTRMPEPVIYKKKSNSYAVYAPFRALGYIASHIPSTLQSRGAAFFLTTCIGDAFQIYNVRVLFSSNRLKNLIYCLLEINQQG